MVDDRMGGRSVRGAGVGVSDRVPAAMIEHPISTLMPPLGQIHYFLVHDFKKTNQSHVTLIALHPETLTRLVSEVWETENFDKFLVESEGNYWLVHPVTNRNIPIKTSLRVAVNSMRWEASG